MFPYFAILAVLTVNSVAYHYSPPSRSPNNLRIQNYSGPIDEEIFVSNKFSDVHCLEIRQSTITNFSRNVLKKFENMEYLSIAFSEIQITDDAVFENSCPKLNKLEIRNWTNFDQKNLKGIGTLPLTKLEIMDQDIPTLRKDMFENSDLEDLRLVRDNIQTIDPMAFRNLINLEYLLISENKIRSFPKEALVPLVKLELLELVSNGLEKLSTDDFPELPRLKKLVIVNEKLKEVNFTNIETKAPTLVGIYLVGNVGVKIYGNNPIVHNSV